VVALAFAAGLGLGVLWHPTLPLAPPLSAGQPLEARVRELEQQAQLHLQALQVSNATLKELVRRVQALEQRQPTYH